MRFGLSASEYASQAGRANGNGRRGLLRLVGVGCVCLFMFVGTQESRARIVEITELVRDAQNVTWANLDGIPVTLGERGAAVDFVRSATKASDGGSGFISDLFPRKTIEVEAAPTLGRKDTGVRGTYTVTLPDMKLIQLEVAYDLIAEGPETRGQMDFYIQIQERNKLDPDQWMTVATFDSDTDRSKIERTRIITYKETLYTPHCFVEKISEWRGQEVRLVLAAEAPKSAVSPQRGRWVQVRLVASTFDYVLDIPPPWVSEEPVKAKAPRMKAGPLVYDESMTTGIDLIDFDDDPVPIFGYPDTGLSVAWNQSSTCFAYFAGARLVNSVTERGTFALKLESGNTLFKSKTIIENSLLRNAQTSYPARVVYPMASSTEDLDNEFLGITGAIAGIVSGTPTIHAFMKAEDHWDNHSDPGNPERYFDKYPNPPKGKCYGRICYATTTSGGGVHRAHDASGVLVENMTPIITHWQPENVAYAEAAYPYEVTPSGVQGVGSAHVIEASDGNYYMYYTRFIDSRTQSRVKLPGEQWPEYMSVLSGADEKTKASMCIAKATKTAVNSPDYQTEPNPWVKYYNSNWNEDAIDGYDTAILKSVPSTCGKVSWNEYRDEFVMITMTPVNDNWTFYLHTSTDLRTWEGHAIDGIYEEYYGTAYPSLVGAKGPDHLYSTDLETARWNYLYYAREEIDDATGLVKGDQTMVRRYLEFIPQ